jgi:hypothetical protein
LPTALNELQRAIAPVRDRQGVVALLDNRVLHRSYGSHVLTALSPLARINYLDSAFFPNLITLILNQLANHSTYQQEKVIKLLGKSYTLI